MCASSLERRVAALELRHGGGAVDPERVAALAGKMLKVDDMLCRAYGGAPLAPELALEQAKRLLTADPQWDTRPISPELQELLDHARANTTRTFVCQGPAGCVEVLSAEPRVGVLHLEHESSSVTIVRAAEPEPQEEPQAEESEVPSVVEEAKPELPAWYGMARIEELIG